MALTLPRLYAILDIDLVRAKGLQPLEVLEVWLGAGLRLIQLRAKSLALGPFLEIAAAAQVAASDAGALLLINDRADVAALARAAGVHVGQQDLSLGEVRQIMATGALVGVSTHSLDQARRAVEGAPDYLALGPAFQTATKVNPAPVVDAGVVRAVVALARSAGLPLVAIGGITLERAPVLLEAGVDSVAVISDLFAGDWRLRPAAYLRSLG